MNQNATTHAPISTKPAIGFFERYLTIWVALCDIVFFHYSTIMEM
ncbi:MULTISPECIES: hypothetical protein [Cupriavidus]|nr:hypothetical protein N234_01900 [Ralstonia pickettii DTP0602]